MKKPMLVNVAIVKIEVQMHSRETLDGGFVDKTLLEEEAPRNISLAWGDVFKENGWTGIWDGVYWGWLTDSEGEKGLLVQPGTPWWTNREKDAELQECVDWTE